MSDVEAVVELAISGLCVLTVLAGLGERPSLEDVDPLVAAQRNHERVEGIEPVVSL